MAAGSGCLKVGHSTKTDDSRGRSTNKRVQLQWCFATGNNISAESISHVLHAAGDVVLQQWSFSSSHAADKGLIIKHTFQTNCVYVPQQLHMTHVLVATASRHQTGSYPKKALKISSASNSSVPVWKKVPLLMPELPLL